MFCKEDFSRYECPFDVVLCVFGDIFPGRSNMLHISHFIGIYASTLLCGRKCVTMLRNVHALKPEHVALCLVTVCFA